MSFTDDIDRSLARHMIGSTAARRMDEAFREIDGLARGAGLSELEVGAVLSDLDLEAQWWGWVQRDSYDGERAGYSPPTAY